LHSIHIYKRDKDSDTGRGERRAVMTLKASGKGILKKAFFDRGTSVKIGDPIAIIGADGERIPFGKELAVLEVTEHKRSKPVRDNRSS
jgi:pyruvate/2-oxoglutarate dehydrogenase complex dihydrolipoamide acyltransferase (E2) component